MNRSTTYLAAAACAAFVLGATGCLWVVNKSQPDTQPIARDPSRVERGQYLVDHVANCFACHPSGPDLADHNKWGRDAGFPGEVWASNITPDTDTGLGNWTDGQVVRAIREGVDNDHEALAPIMPYGNYVKLSDEDVRAIVAYVRTLPPQRIVVPPRNLDIPFSFIVNFIPKPAATPVRAPDRGDKIAYGEYLATVGSCASCHTPHGPQGPEKKLEYAGGMPFPASHAGGQTVVSPNITSDPDTGIGKWTDEQVRDAITKGVLPGDRKMRPPMPWKGYAGMSDEDVAALVAYIRTIPPIRHSPTK